METRARSAAARPGGGAWGSAAGTAMAALLLGGLLAAPPALQAQDQAPGPVTPEEADAIRDTLTRPDVEGSFTLGDLVAFPFRVVGYPVRWTFQGLALGAGWVARSGAYEVGRDAWTGVRELGFRPSLATDLGSRSGPSLHLGWVGLLPLRLEAAVSSRLYRRYAVEAGGSVGAVRLGGGVSHRVLADEPFWGVGLERPVEAEVDFRQEVWRVEGSVGWRPAPPWALEVGAAWEERTVEPGGDDDVPDLRDRYAAGDLPGLEGSRFAVGAAEVRWDGQEVDRLWTSGPRLRVRGEGYRGLGGTEMDFGAVEAEAEVGLPFSRVRYLKLRAWGRTLMGGEGRVPFTHLPALGGGETLRGYEWGRFRDRAVLSASAEWRFELWRDLRQRGRIHGLAFADGGSAGASLGDLDGTRGSLGVGLGGRWRGTVVEGWIAWGDDGSRVSGSVRTEPW